MNKSELVELIAEKADISKAKAALAVEAFTAGVTDALSKGRNPATGKEITIKATTLPKFRPGKALKDAVK